MRSSHPCPARFPTTRPRWTSNGKSILVATHWWEVPLKVEKVDLATGRREDVVTLSPGELTGAVQIVQAAFNGDAKSYRVRGAEDDVAFFLVGRGE